MSQKGARSKLADVLADIKNSRAEDNHEAANQEVAPAPTKRRSAVNYVALSGHTPRQRTSHSHHGSASNANNSASEHKANSTTTTSNTPQSSSRSRTYVLRLFDRTVDLAQFTGDKSKGDDASLYPVCREWVHCNDPKKNLPHSSKSPTRTQPTTRPEKPANGGSPSTCQQQEQPTNELIDNEVHSLPPPSSKIETIQQFRLTPANEETDIRIPQSVRDFKPPENIEETIDKTIHTMNKEQCFESNRQRWKKVKEDWKEARLIHESRYKESFKILEDLCLS